MLNLLTKYKLLILFITVLLSMTIADGQKKSLSKSQIDTTNVVVRIYHGDLPGQTRDLSADYSPQICAYTFNNSQLVKFTVTSFELVYHDVTLDSNTVVYSESKYFSPAMRTLMERVNGEFDKLFLDNIAIANNKGEKLVIRGRRPLTH